MTFREWLLQQTNRNDPIGDLARDLRDDSTAGQVTMTRFETRYPLSDAARGALLAARAEYRRQR